MVLKADEEGCWNSSRMLWLLLLLLRVFFAVCMRSVVVSYLLFLAVDGFMG